MIIFKELCYADPQIKGPLIANVISKLSADRERNVVERDLIKLVAKSFIAMGFTEPKPMKGEPTFYWIGKHKLDFYRDHFEKYILDAAQADYAKKA